MNTNLVNWLPLPPCCRRASCNVDSSGANVQNYLTNEIAELVKKLNTSSQDTGAADSMVKKVEDILNEHHRTLQVSSDLQHMSNRASISLQTI